MFDPACGSGGMFVQTSHFIEHVGGDTARTVVFYGQEKNPTTIDIARMNLAVHGLDGRIADAITYYQDEHRLAGTADFVMANPPFNVDLVDAERIKADPRLPFGLPGVNKQKKVSNGNYLWASYFWSYLAPTSRAGFVMSSQASSAGHGEKEVRQRLVATGDVDVMVSVRSNFFYTRTVPCELWFNDRGKPAARRDRVLMIDARGVYRKVSRTINDFAPEQLASLSAIVWLYRGQGDRFLALAQTFLTATAVECRAVAAALAPFEAKLAAARAAVGVVPDATAELRGATAADEADRAALLVDLAKFAKGVPAAAPKTMAPQRAARAAFDPLAERVKGLVKQIDRGHAQVVALLATDKAAADGLGYDRRGVGRLLKELDAGRKAAAEQLRRVTYYHRQAAWLLDRFPDGTLADVPGLVKLVSRAEIAAADWSLTPGCYVGVARPRWTRTSTSSRRCATSTPSSPT